MAALQGRHTHPSPTLPSPFTTAASVDDAPIHPAAHGVVLGHTPPSSLLLQVPSSLWQLFFMAQRLPQARPRCFLPGHLPGSKHSWSVWTHQHPSFLNMNHLVQGSPCFIVPDTLRAWGRGFRRCRLRVGPTTRLLGNGCVAVCSVRASGELLSLPANAKLLITGGGSWERGTGWHTRDEAPESGPLLPTTGPQASFFNPCGAPSARSAQHTPGR